MATKPKTPPKAPAKAEVATPPAVPPTGGGTDPAPDQPSAGMANTADISAAPAPAAAVAAEVKAPKADKAKADVDTALDRLGKIESEAIRMGGDSGQAIRQLACEAMVALGFK